MLKNQSKTKNTFVKLFRKVMTAERWEVTQFEYVLLNIFTKNFIDENLTTLLLLKMTN
jgi:hypothetical protein